ncbi:hypothetical protein B0H13DRAFT_2348377 [Mycena leptocephala]|nr:hypothetical protein B0H13DRAFT_2392452 [Mycena leptocephala]KAJ7874879.1 hypothetical protein B0H13DRAFT_2348377 [Mycena leptocephala]
MQADYTTLHITNGDDPAPTVVHISTPEPTLSVQQPHATPLAWSSFLEFCTGSNNLDTVVIDGVDFVPDPSRIAPLPLLAKLQRLEIKFQSKRGLALLVSRLNIPSLMHAKIWLHSKEDVECLILCSTIFRTVPSVVLAGPCPVFVMVEQIFGMLHAVKTLDISQGSDALFGGLCSAIVYPATNQALNWRACPYLRHLRLGNLANVSLEFAKFVVCERQRFGYDSLESITIPKTRTVEEAEELWFADRAIALIIE